MPVFLVLFLLFCGWLFYERKKSEREQETKSKDFWEREALANTTLRQDTSDVVYIKPNFEKLPYDEAASGEQKVLQDKLFGLRGQSIANLSEYTNTDLKIKYGVLNFQMLSEADENYNTLITSLTELGKLKLSLGEYKDAEAFFREVTGYGPAPGPVYCGLADIYAASGDSEALRSLIREVSETSSLTKDATLSYLRDALGKSFTSSSVIEDDFINQS